MAAKRKLREISSTECNLEMTSMIDVTFLMIIFFICTLKFKTLDGKLSAYLPKDVGVNTTQAEPIEKVEILVRVMKEGTKLKPGDQREPYLPGDKGRYVFDADRQLEYGVGPFKTRNLADLHKRLAAIYKERLATNPEKVPATIDARPGTVYEDVAKVLDQTIDAGFTDITFVGAYDDNIR